MSNLLQPKIQAYRAQIEEIVKELHELTIKIGSDDLAKTVSDLRNRIHEPFMFVIVGEVKAGKSSFINALLEAGREIAKVAPQPLTDTIQQILYAEQEQVVSINPFLKKVFVPLDILKEIAIVDTPGTNTIVENHQQITESFIPASDLIVFVFEAKNPYRQSSWDFFKFIHSDWQKKVIFVLQQKDLLPEPDLLVNFNGLHDYAVKMGVPSPQIFAVSAKEELEGMTQQSGFSNIREYIKNNITGGKAPLLKLQNNIATSQNINQRIANGLDLRKKQYEEDVFFRQDIRLTLEDQAGKSQKQVDVLVSNLVTAYDGITFKKEQELKEGLGFFTLLRRSVASIFSKKEAPKTWLEEFAKDLEIKLNSALHSRLNEGVDEVADSIQQMAKIIDLKIRNSKTILRNDHEIFSDIAERRSNILKDLQETFAQFLRNAENFSGETLFPDKRTLSPNLATGGGLAVIGIILAAVVNGAVFDITGGVLTTIGLLFAGVSTRIKRKGILDGFTAEIQKGRRRIEEEVSDDLKKYIRHLKTRIDANFGRFDRMLEKENGQIEALMQNHYAVAGKLSAMENNLRNEMI